MPTFYSLRAKLTVLYAGLFAAVMLVIGAVVYSAVEQNAERVVRQELTASSTVFDRIWALRAAQLENSAGLLARDFGFRSALASHDVPTITSALENLKVRLGVDTAFIIGVDGQVTAAGDARPMASLTPASLAALQSDDAVSGVAVMNGAPYQTIAVPVLAPTAVGWVVFANRLDHAQTASLQQLSAIPLEASILDRDGAHSWRDAARRLDARDGAGLGRFVDTQLKAGGAGPSAFGAGGGASIALVKPLAALDPDRPAVLMLRYPLARAMAPYQMLLAALAAIAAAGVALLVLGSWTLARGVTRPLSALQEAAAKLSSGEMAAVAVETHDEVGRLAESFNSMAEAIGERERRITHLALHDAETDLPNREAMERKVAALVEQSGADHVFIAALGVDRFAEVRGAIGHALFAELIAVLGERVEQQGNDVRRARLSTAVLGLAFVAEDAAEAEAIAERVRRQLEEPVRVAGNTVDVGLTLGLAGAGEDASRVASVIDRASIALDQARDARRRTARFDPAVYGDPAANLSLMSDMRGSIEAGHMALFHQPKFDLRRREVIGVEGLVRWFHPTRGFMPPDRFIGMAEETGHIRALTDWVLAQAIIDQRVMAGHGRIPAVSVNISGRLLGDAEFAESALRRVADAAGEICFEITETAVIENPDLALSIIDRFASAGVAISIDDYGTGLSSLAYLKQIRANELKIDKSFVFAIDESQRDALLVRSTIDLAHSLGLKVTAEGVETETALALLSSMGCDLAQGYLIARPMPLDKLCDFLATPLAVAVSQG